MSLTENDRRLLVEANQLARSSIVASPPSGSAYCWDAMRKAAGFGLLGTRVAERSGGLGRSFGFFSALGEATARVDFGFSLALLNSAGIAATLEADASPAVRERLLPGLLSSEHVGCTALTEPGAGSDASAISTVARKTANGWVINGRKAWIINAAVARVIVVYAQTEPGSGAKGVASFVIDADRAGFVREPAFDLQAGNNFGLGGFSLQDYVLADEELLHPPGQAFKYIMGVINGARTYVAAMACGMVTECLDVARAYGDVRCSFGKPLSEHQGWRWPLADAKTDLTAARLLVQRACERIDAGEDAQIEAAEAKLFASRMAETHIAALEQAMGAEGLRAKHPFGRHQWAARATNLVDGSSEMLRERIFASIRRH